MRRSTQCSRQLGPFVSLYRLSKAAQSLSSKQLPPREWHEVFIARNFTSKLARFFLRSNSNATTLCFAPRVVSVFSRTEYCGLVQTSHGPSEMPKSCVQHSPAPARSGQQHRRHIRVTLHLARPKAIPKLSRMIHSQCGEEA
jgi:hypothetical protein